MDRYLVVYNNRKLEYIDSINLMELGRHIDSKYGMAAKIKYIERIAIDVHEEKENIKRIT
jgi:hypothetical protein